MGYVKISDPNIIDLNAIHNIINVVNQHSDTLNLLTNNLGANATGNVNYSATDLQHLFDTGSQMIIYGRSSIDVNSEMITSTSPAGKIYSKSVTFAGGTTGLPPFTTTNPLVFLTLHTGNNSAGTVTSTFADAVANAWNVTSSTFNIRLFMKESISGSQKIYVNWMVIGPKNK